MTKSCHRPHPPQPMQPACPTAPKTEVTVQSYVCDLTVASMCEIIELDGLYYISQAAGNKADPRLADSPYSKGYLNYDDARQLSNQCQCDQGDLCDPCTLLNMLPISQQLVGG